MKLNYESSRGDEEKMVGSGGQPARAGRNPMTPGDPKGFRRLKFNELVSLGDFVEDELLGMQPWDGPRGFQAGSFVRPIYRAERKRATTPKVVSRKRK